MLLSGFDFLGLDRFLSDEEKLVRETVRRFVKNEVSPIIEHCYEQGQFPTELVSKLGKLEILGANLPEKYGCAGMNSLSYGLIMQELEAGDSGIRSFASVQGALCMYPIFAFGSEEQRVKYLPSMATGKTIGCFGLTEPNQGSDPGEMLTRAKKVSDGWVINGSKSWITNGAIADIAIVWARVEGDDVRGFIIEKGTPGFTATETKHKLSLRASITSELFFQDCRISDENILPNAKGLKGPLMCLTQARYGIAWGVIGAAMSCLEVALNYARERVQFGRAIAAFQLTQEKLVSAFVEITKAQLLNHQLAKLKDEGYLKPVQVSMAKLNNVAIALNCARVCRSILGANGIMGEYGIMRHMCNLESVYTYEGTHEIHTLILGNYLTGFDAFR